MEEELVRFEGVSSVSQALKTVVVVLGTACCSQRRAFHLDILLY
jgi:hypothetical protein